MDSFNEKNIMSKILTVKINSNNIETEINKKNTDGVNTCIGHYNNSLNDLIECMFNTIIEMNKKIEELKRENAGDYHNENKKNHFKNKEHKNKYKGNNNFNDRNDRNDRNEKNEMPDRSDMNLQNTFPTNDNQPSYAPYKHDKGHNKHRPNNNRNNGNHYNKNNNGKPVSFYTDPLTSNIKQPQVIMTNSHSSIYHSDENRRSNDSVSSNSRSSGNNHNNEFV